MSVPVKRRAGLESFLTGSSVKNSEKYSRRFPVCVIGRRTLAVDYGLARVGLAVSVGVAPRALPCFVHKADPDRVASVVADIARSSCAVDIVVGLPLNSRGEEGEQAVATRVFVKALVRAAPWAKICLLDERFTTQMARAQLLDAEVPEYQIPELIDSEAAIQISERYFFDGSDEKPIIVHEPPSDEDERAGYTAGPVSTVPGSDVERVGYSVWKKNTMMRAAEQVLALEADKLRKKSGKRKKDKRNKKKTTTMATTTMATTTTKGKHADGQHSD